LRNYATFVGEIKPGESQELSNVLVQKFYDKPPEIDTMLKMLL